MNTRSLKTQLRLWLLIPMLVVLTISAVVSYTRAVRYANRAYDRALYRTVLALSDEIVVNDRNQVMLNLPQVAKNLLKYNDGDRMYFRIEAPNGALVSGDAGLRLPPQQPAANHETYFNGAHNGEKIRGVIYALPMSEQAREGHILIAMAETTRKREAMVAEIVEEMLLPQILIMILATLMIEISIRYGLKPVQVLTSAIHKRSHRDLTPVETPAPMTELQPLIDAMNALLERVRQGIQQQQEFIADASHQMRTPMAGLQTEAELALREATSPQQKESLNMMVRSAARLSHLIQRLLSLAKAEATVTAIYPQNTVHLKSVIEEVCQRLIEAALKKEQELSVEIETAQDQVTGDAMMLAEMLGNLLENAIHYTPVGGQIVLRLTGENDTVSLHVLDNGSGIPPSAYQDIFKRFHRLNPNQGNGCGLGLAIVKEIATWHEAKIEVGPGLPNTHAQGACFTVQFRRYESQSLPAYTGAHSAV